MQEHEMEHLVTLVTDLHDRLNVQKMSDHDLLIRLSTQSEGIAIQLTGMATASAAHAERQDSRMRAMEDRFDKRVRTLEQTRWLMLGGAATIGALAGFLGRVLKP